VTVATNVCAPGLISVPVPRGMVIWVASASTAARSRTCGRFYSCDTLLEGLAQDLQDVASELRQFIQKEHAMVRQGHLPLHWHLAPTDQPHVRNRVMGGLTWARRDAGRAVAGEAGDALDACGLEGFGEGHIRQDGGEPPCPHRLPGAGGDQP
jgi:hypothetical protein